MQQFQQAVIEAVEGFRNDIRASPDRRAALNRSVRRTLADIAAELGREPEPDPLLQELRDRFAKGALSEDGLAVFDSAVARYQASGGNLDAAINPGLVYEHQRRRVAEARIAGELTPDEIDTGIWVLRSERRGDQERVPDRPDWPKAEHAAQLAALADSMIEGDPSLGVLRLVDCAEFSSGERMAWSIVGATAERYAEEFPESVVKWREPAIRHIDGIAGPSSYVDPKTTRPPLPSARPGVPEHQARLHKALCELAGDAAGVAWVRSGLRRIMDEIMKPHDPPESAPRAPWPLPDRPLTDDENCFLAATLHDALVVDGPRLAELDTLSGNTPRQVRARMVLLKQCEDFRATEEGGFDHPILPGDVPHLLDVIERVRRASATGGAPAAAGDGAGGGADEEDAVITLDQAAARVSKSKRTLEKHPDLPEPDYPGRGRGKAHHWKWSTLLPFLRTHYRADLPERFPGSRAER